MQRILFFSIHLSPDIKDSAVTIWSDLRFHFLCKDTGGHSRKLLMKPLYLTLLRYLFLLYYKRHSCRILQCLIWVRLPVSQLQGEAYQNQ